MVFSANMFSAAQMIHRRESDSTLVSPSIVHTVCIIVITLSVKCSYHFIKKTGYDCLQCLEIILSLISFQI